MTTSFWRRRARPGLLALWLLLLAALTLWGYRRYFENRAGTEQPIPFSHRVHAADKEISCFFCHTGAAETARAGIPPVETCMLCHSRIIITYPPVRKVRQAYFEQHPIPWQRVFTLPDFVYFDHSVHLARGIDCGHCHGDVAHMDRVQGRGFIMGFCIGCHRQHNATHDCFTCHR